MFRLSSRKRLLFLVRPAQWADPAGRKNMGVEAPYRPGLPEDNPNCRGVTGNWQLKKLLTLESTLIIILKNWSTL
jgi:hypothetical protein